MKHLVILALFVFATQSHAASWADKVKLGADLRLRADHTEDGDLDARTRPRIRARATVTGEVNDSTKLVVRLATGAPATETQKSSNQDLGETSAKKAFALDLAYVDYKLIDSISFQGGKTPNPFISMGKNELIFDADWTLEGAVARFQSTDSYFIPFATVGASMLTERAGKTSSGNGPKEDSYLLGAQVGMKLETESCTTTLATSYYDFTNVEGNSVMGPSGATSFAGNSNSGGVYQRSYRVWDIGLEMGAKMFELPYAFYAELIGNTAIKTDRVGYVAGARLGQSKLPGNFWVDYSYREVAKDATLGAIADSDFAGGGTAVRGHRVQAGYKPVDNTTIAATYIDSSKGTASATTTHYKRAQMDLMFDF